MASPYQPLETGHIRILCLHPGNPGDPLRGRLETLHLGNASITQAYSAISYAWNSLELPDLVHLPEGRSISITSSLHGALQRFRTADKDEKFWADAICISQTDSAEKAAQIMRMWDVFAQARTVLVWLGDSTPPDTYAFMQMWRYKAIHLDLNSDPINGGQSDNSRQALIDDTEKCLCCSTPVPAAIPFFKSDERQVWVAGDASISYTQMALDQLLRRPWFSRLWVVQEIAAARSGESILVCCEPSRCKFSHGNSLIVQQADLTRYLGTFSNPSLQIISTCGTSTCRSCMVSESSLGSHGENQNHARIKIKAPCFFGECGGSQNGASLTGM